MNILDELKKELEDQKALLKLILERVDVRPHQEETGGYEMAQEVTGYSKKTLQRMAATGDIPKASGKREKVMFHKPTLIKWMNERGKPLSNDFIKQEVAQEYSKFKRLRK